MMNKLTQKGDTIVEVLLALTILSTILIGAYVSANRAQNASRASQERAEAVKVAETQIERLKARLARGDTQTGQSCINSDLSEQSTASASGDSPFIESLEAASFPYSGSCGNLESRYNVAIQKSGDVYEFLVRWDRIGGGKDQINMYYKAY